MHYRNLVVYALVVLSLAACGGNKTSIDSLGIRIGQQHSLEPELEASGEPPAGVVASLTPNEKKAFASLHEIRFSDTVLAHTKIRDQFLYLHRNVGNKLNTWFKRAELYLPYAQQAFREKGLPVELSYLAFIESGYNPKAYSRSGAAGVWQFMPFTGRRFGLSCDWWIDERRDPYQASHAAASYLAILYKQFNDWSLAIASYNAGEGKIGRAVAATGAKDFFELLERNHTLNDKMRLREETLHYVPRFAAMVKIANNMKLLGYAPINMNASPNLRQVEVRGGTDLQALSRTANMDWETFSKFNPAYRRKGTPPGKTTYAYVPTNRVASVKRFLSQPGSAFAGYQRYQVRRGDSWSQIANTFGVSVASLKKVNNTSSNMLRPGQRVMIPMQGSSAVASAKKSTPKRRTTTVAQRSSKTSTKSTRSTSTYRVRGGDTLYSLARRFGCSVTQLQKTNGLRSANDLAAGQKLKVPGKQKSTHVAQAPRRKTKPSAPIVVKRRANYLVQNGDTVWNIARKFDVNPVHLMEWNNLGRSTVIKPGDMISVYMD